ncbi:MAG TPA: 3-deoxy-7-phosphoheptulonate synthase [Verrucomicrobiae bacterium]|nr:3-deoxy-7-phosphoheptulonate synthase [Verrucomicrobiae bacterium]
MLVVLERNATPEQVEAVCAEVRKMGLTPHALPGAQRTVVGITGNLGMVNAARLEVLAGVIEVIHVTQPFKLVSREFRKEDTIVRVGPSGNIVEIGGKRVCVMAGPCAVESKEQAFAVAEKVKASGAKIFRGGAFKPRTSPYSFQGLGEEGLKILAAVREKFGLLVVTEAIDTESLSQVEEYADVIQIGARNMQNFSLLKRVGKSAKPVLLKRGMSATLQELLMAAEYIVSEGNPNVILCERGVRTFADHTRNTLDLSAIPFVERTSHLPIIADPSHGTGRREKVLPMSRAAVAAGADGLLIEVHHKPEEALSDGQESIYPEQFATLMKEISAIAQVIGREV